MTVFSGFSDILPDPDIKLSISGNIDPSGLAGPGFSGVNFKSNREGQVSRTMSGRGIPRGAGSQYWSFSIKYNPMFRDEFDVVDSFLSLRNPRLTPFYVSLPQYSRPKDSTFEAFCRNNQILASGQYEAGDTSITINSSASILGNPLPGDAFSIDDPEDSNHKKVYKVGAVETNDNYQGGTLKPTTDERRIHFSPCLQRDVSDNSVINFIRPLFRVVTSGDVQEYELDTDNLYQFTLDLEELQP